jgi:serine/threonine protein kinase
LQIEAFDPHNLYWSYPQKKAISLTMRGQLPDMKKLPVFYQELVKKCCAHKAEERPTMAEIAEELGEYQKQQHMEQMQQEKKPEPQKKKEKKREREEKQEEEKDERAAKRQKKKSPMVAPKNKKSLKAVVGAKKGPSATGGAKSRKTRKTPAETSSSMSSSSGLSEQEMADGLQQAMDAKCATQALVLEAFNNRPQSEAFKLESARTLAAITQDGCVHT